VAFDVMSYFGGRNSGVDSFKVRRFDSITWEHVTQSFYPSHDRTLVCRLNGPAFQGEERISSYAVTEEDNIDWIGNFERMLGTFLGAELRQSPLLSLGHSARDWSQRALLRSLHELHREGPPNLAIALNPSPLSVITWQRYGVDFYNLDLDDWSTRMSAGPA